MSFVTGAPVLVNGEGSWVNWAPKLKGFRDASWAREGQIRIGYRTCGSSGALKYATSGGNAGNCSLYCHAAQFIAFRIAQQFI